MTFEFEVRSRIPNIRAVIDDATREVLEDVLDDIVDEARDSMEQPKSGRMYRWSPAPGKVPSRPHQASAPGEAPAIRSGNLYAEVHKEVAGLRGWAVWDSDYGGYLEWGTAKMMPRPFIAPAVDKVVRGNRVYRRQFIATVEAEGM